MSQLSLRTRQGLQLVHQQTTTEHLAGHIPWLQWREIVDKNLKLHLQIKYHTYSSLFFKNLWFCIHDDYYLILFWREFTGKEMAKVQVTNVTVLDNPTAYLNPFQFEITFECLEDLSTGKWSPIYRVETSMVWSFTIFFTSFPPPPTRDSNFFSVLPGTLLCTVTYLIHLLC